MPFEVFSTISGSVQNAAWSDVEKALATLPGEEGADFELRIVPEPEQGPLSFSVQSENDYYKPAMSLSDDIKELVNPDFADKEWIPLGGYDCEPMSLTRDFDLIVSMVKEFYETGNCTSELLK